MTAEIDDAQGKRTRSEDQAGKVGGQDLDNLQSFLSLFNHCLMSGLVGKLLIANYLLLTNCYFLFNFYSISIYRDCFDAVVAILI